MAKRKPGQNGKGDSNRTSDWRRYWSEHDRIFGKGRQKLMPPDPFMWTEEHERALYEAKFG